MNRRHVTLSLAAGALASAAGWPAAAMETVNETTPKGAGWRPKVAMVVHPDMVLLDLVGPQTVLSLAMADMHLVWKTREPVVSDVGVPVSATTAFADCPQDLDVLFVPGGLKGSVALMDDADIIAFLADRGRRAKYVTSVCTGSLVLAAAGLLKGYRATSHWYVRDLLPLMGSIAADDRVVADRNRVTGAGVTAGLDFGLALAAMIRGEDYARRIQLVLEYDPNPPFQAGTPARAGSGLTSDVRERRAPLLAAARDAAGRAAARLMP